MSDFNRQKLMDNITALIQIRGMKVGDVESAVGISAGYLSRLRQKDSEAAPSVELVFKLAQLFDVSTDWLIEGDFSQATDNLMYFASFLNRLKKMTDCNQLEWDSYTTAKVDEMLLGRQKNDLFIIQKVDDIYDIATEKVKNPLQIPDDSNEKESPIRHSLAREFLLPDWNKGMHWAWGARRIRSSFYPDNKIWLSGTAFKCEIDGDTYLYIFPMDGEFLNPAYDQSNSTISRKLIIPFFEIYFEKFELKDDFDFSSCSQPVYEDYVWNTYPILQTHPDFIGQNANYARVANDIANLYSAINRRECDLKIARSVRDSIGRFLGNNP